MPNELLEVAKIGKTIGLKGALKLHDKSDFPKQFKKGAKFYLSNGEILEILSFSSANSSVVFVGFDSIEKAQVLVNKTLYQSKENTKKSCKLNKDEFFYFDIMGLEICENSQILGVVSDIVETGANYLFEVTTSQNLIQNGLPKTFFVPYIDNFVEKICLDEGKIYTKNARAILENS